MRTAISPRSGDEQLDRRPPSSRRDQTTPAAELLQDYPV